MYQRLRLLWLDGWIRKLVTYLAWWPWPILWDSAWPLDSTNPNIWRQTSNGSTGPGFLGLKMGPLWIRGNSPTKTGPLLPWDPKEMSYFERNGIWAMGSRDPPRSTSSDRHIYSCVGIQWAENDRKVFGIGSHRRVEPLEVLGPQAPWFCPSKWAEWSVVDLRYSALTD